MHNVLISGICRCLVWAILPAVVLVPPAGVAQDEVKAADRTKIAVFVIDEQKGMPSAVAEDLGRDATLEVHAVTAAGIQSGELRRFDVVLFPGGSGSAQGKKLGEVGRSKVREFVRLGGGYIGICAGAYLATSDYEWSLHILDARVLDRKHWARGFGSVRLRLAQSASESLQIGSEETDCYYHQGPLLAPAERSDLPDYSEWASFQSEVRKEGVPGGVMPGTTAIAATSFGSGRVLAISPHPERTETLNHVLPLAVHWVHPTEKAK